MMWLPNALTLSNLCSGILMIVLALQGNHEGVLLAVMAALLLDFLDGFAARALQSYHPLGGQLDSLADMVSFGVAPGILLYTIVQANLPDSPLAYLSFFFPVCVAIRLARFNLDERPSKHFFGLPSPSAAIFVFGIYLSSHADTCVLCIQDSTYWPLFILIGVGSVAVLMLTDVPHLSLKSNPLARQNAVWFVVFLFGIVLLGLLLRWEAISSGVLLYILLSLIYFRKNQVPSE